MTCKSSTADPLGGDTDGQSPGKCVTSVTLPPQLADGRWTLQWSWFGGMAQLGDYYSCVDYEVAGGLPYTPGRIVTAGKFGDVHFPGQDKCMFWNTDALGICVKEPCTTGDHPGKQSGLPKLFAQGTFGTTVTANETTPLVAAPLLAIETIVKTA